ncbi:hypothetical protein ACFX1S_003789 [Malus domestica]
MEVGGPDEEGWTTVIPKWKRRCEKRISGESSKEGRSYKEVASSLKLKWTPKADLVHDWRRAGKAKEHDRQVNADCLDYRGIASDDFLFYVKFINEWFLPDYLVFDNLVDITFQCESYNSSGLRLGKLNFFYAMSMLEQNQDAIMPSVQDNESGAREHTGDFVAALDATEMTSTTTRPTVGMLSPRKRIREQNVDEAGPSTYLDELD